MSDIASPIRAPGRVPVPTPAVPDGVLRRKCACGGGAGVAGECAACREKKLTDGVTLQRKLVIGSANDPTEREADAVAERVMRMGSLGSGEGPTEASGSVTLQRRASGEGGAGEAPPIVHNVLSSPGRPLDPETRGFMETRFGQDFSNVRIHTGDRAAEAAQAVQARAFTVGRDVVFNMGEYNAQSRESRTLLAHELAHVSQGEVLGSDAGAVLLPYRKSGTPNFGACDTATLKEASFPKTATARETVPWIKDIFLHFDDSFFDSAGDLTASGNLKSEYAKNKAALPDIKVQIAGGSATAGLSDTGNHTVGRIEGCGYNQKRTAPGPTHRLSDKGPGRYYHKPAEKDFANMSFAVFFTNVQAIHIGLLTHGSLSCAHVEDEKKMQQINYHSVQGKTKVHVSYDPAALTSLCCQRYFATGRMVSNPCGKQSKKHCDELKAAAEVVGNAIVEGVRAVGRAIGENQE